MKIACTGYKGRIGSRLIALGAIPLDCDVTDELAVMRELRYKKPDIVVHAASIASIAECEGDGYERAIQVNFRGTNIVCQEAQRVGARVVYLSTEQVFDGQKGMYSEEDEPNPINDYGRSKLGGEAVCTLYGAKIIRLSRGISREAGKDIDIYIENLKNEKEINVPSFIFRSYSHLDFLAQAVWQAAQSFEKLPAILHLGGEAPLSFHQLIIIIASAMKLNINLIEARKVEVPENPRPFNCGLDVTLAKSLGLPIFSARDTVMRFVGEYARV